MFRTAFRFSIRELLLVTVIVAVLSAWWVDRSQLAWSHAQNLATADRLHAMLDKADAGWRERSSPNLPIGLKARSASPVGGYAIGVGIVAIFILMVILVWKGKIHPSVLEKQR